MKKSIRFVMISIIELLTKVTKKMLQTPKKLKK